MADEENRTEATAPDVSSADTEISDAIGKILANPEIISNVASAMGLSQALSKPVASNISEQSEASANALPADAVSSFAPILNLLSKGSSSSNSPSNQVCLLRALRPYVSDARCRAIEQIIKMTEMSQLIKKMNSQGGKNVF